MTCHDKTNEPPSEPDFSTKLDLASIQLGLDQRTQTITHFKVSDNLFCVKKRARLFKQIRDQIEADILKSLDDFKSDETILPDLKSVHKTEVIPVAKGNFLQIQEFFLKIPNSSWPYPSLVSPEMSLQIHETLKERLRKKYRNIIKKFKENPEVLPDVSNFNRQTICLFGETLTVAIWSQLNFAIEPEFEWSQIYNLGNQRIKNRQLTDLTTFLSNQKLRGEATISDTFTIENSFFRFHKIDFTGEDLKLYEKVLDQIRKRKKYDKLLTEQAKLVSKATEQWRELAQLETEYGYQTKPIQSEYHTMMQVMDLTSLVFLKTTTPEVFSDWSLKNLVQVGTILRMAEAYITHQKAKNRLYRPEEILQVLDLFIEEKDQARRLALTQQLFSLNLQNQTWIDNMGVKYSINDIIALPLNHQVIKAIEADLAFAPNSDF